MRTKRVIFASPLALLSLGLSGCLGHSAAPVPTPTPTPAHVALAVKKPQSNPALEPLATQLVAARSLIGKGAGLLQEANDAHEQGLDDSARADEHDALRRFDAANTVLIAADASSDYLHAFDSLQQSVELFIAATNDLLNGTKGASSRMAAAQSALNNADKALRARPETHVSSVIEDAAVLATKALTATRPRTTKRVHPISPPRRHAAPAAHKATSSSATASTPMSVPTKPAAPSPTPDAAVAQSLAALDRGAPVGNGDSLVAQFQKLLNQLAPRCSEGDYGVAQLAETVHADLARSGVHHSYLTILQKLNGLVPTHAANTYCAPYFQTYVQRQTRPHATSTPVPPATPRTFATVAPHPAAPAPTAPPVRRPSQTVQSVAQARAEAQATMQAAAGGAAVPSISPATRPAATVLTALQGISSQLQQAGALLRSYQASSDPRVQVELQSTRQAISAQLAATTTRLAPLRAARRAHGAGPALSRAIRAYRRAVKALAAAESDAQIGARAHYAQDLDAVDMHITAGDGALKTAAAHLGV